MRKLLTISALAAAVCLTVAAAALADVRVTDQPYVRHDGGTDAAIAACSNDSPGTTAGGNRQANEPAVAINPAEPRFVVASSNDYCGLPVFGDAWQGIYVSKDGGKSWTDSLLPGYPGDTSAEGQSSPLETNSGDPLLDWDLKGNLFAGGISFNRTVSRDQVGAEFASNGHAYVATFKRDKRSPLGIDFIRTVIVAEGTPGAFPFAGRFNDKPSLKVDDWSLSPNSGNVYIAWTLFPGGGQDKVLFSRSTDSGKTFSRRIELSQGLANAQGSDIAVTPNGDVYVVWRQFASTSGLPSAVVYVKSTDGGRSFSLPRTVQPLIGYDRGDTYASGGFARDCGDGAFLCVSALVFHRWDSLPAITADSGGNLYVSWEQVTPSADNGDTYHPDGQSQVVVTKSTTGGLTWSAPVKVDPQAAGHQLAPNLEFDKSTGTIALVYWDTRSDPSYSPNLPPGNLSGGTNVCGVPASATCNVQNTSVATSNDGVSWSTTQVSSVGHQPNYEMFGNRQIPFHGDYNWVDADGGKIVAVWGDNRDVVPGTDPREATQDGFDVLQCRAQNPDGSFGADTCPNAGGLNQNIWGAALG
jgi:hypothetical protein